MSGTAELWIPPSGAVSSGGSNPYIEEPTNPGQWYRFVPPILPPNGGTLTGVADCTNLIASSPPTLLEVYELVSHSISWACLTELAAGAYTTPPNIGIEIALLVNDRVRYTVRETVQASLTESDEWAVASDTLVADLVNPIRLGARDRLTLRVGFQEDQAAGTVDLYIAQEWLPGSNYQPTGAESTITYNVYPVPATRRL